MDIRYGIVETNRSFSYLLVFFVGFLLLTGCSERIPPDKRVLRFSFWGGFLEFRTWKQIKAGFERKYPDVYVKLEYAPGTDQPGALLSKMVAGTAADVMMVDDDGLCFLATKGYLEPLDERMRRDAEELRLDRFLPTSLDSTEYAGRHWAMPFDGFCQLMFVNLDLFEEAGIPEPTKEWTWKDFVRIAHQLTLDKDNDGRIDQFGAVVALELLNSLPVFMSYGARWMDPEKKRITIESPQALEALRIYADLFFRKKSVPTYSESALMTGEVMILTGRVAMCPGPLFIVLNLKQIQGDSWDVFHMPSGPKGKATRVSWDTMGIYSKIPDEQKELAWKWIKYVLSSGPQRMIGKSGRALPVRPEDGWASFVDPDSPQHEERFLDGIQEYGVLVPQMPATRRWRTEAESVFQIFAFETVNEWGKALMRGEVPDESKYHGDPLYWMTPEKCLKLVQERCQTVVDEFNERGF